MELFCTVNCSRLGRLIEVAMEVKRLLEKSAYLMVLGRFGMAPVKAFRPRYLPQVSQMRH